MRPHFVVVVAGTGTEVGKTWMACRLAAALRTAGREVQARKPAQSFESGTPPPSTDAGLLARATGDDPYAVCPRHRWYDVAMAPPMAAEALGRPHIRMHELVDETGWDPEADVADHDAARRADVGLVETAGGVRSPLAHDGDAVGLAKSLEPDLVLLVADPALGVINGVLLSLDALEGFEAVLFLNRFDDGDDLHRRNREWLQRVTGLPVLVEIGELTDLVERSLG